MLTEEWKLLSISDNYIISNKGDVIEKETNAFIYPCFRSGIRQLYVKLYINERSDWYRIDILVLDTFTPMKHDDCKVLHKDGNRFNNRLDNLTWKKSYGSLKEYYHYQKVQSIETGVIYESIDDCSYELGISKSKIKNSIETGKSAIPGKHFTAIF